MLKDAMRKRMLQSVTPSETAVGQRIANILTVTEYELFQAVDRLVDAADDLDGEFHVHEDMETRRDRLLEIADAVAEQRFEAWWWENYADRVVDNPARARQFAGISKSEWRQAIEQLADHKRARLEDAQDDVDDRTDAQLAAERIREAFGVDLATFATEVVEWEAAEHVDGIVRSNLRSSTETIHQIADVLEDA